MNKQLLVRTIDLLGEQYEESKDQAILDNIEQEYLKYLKDYPQDSETWIELAIFVNEAPLADFRQAIKYLDQLLVWDSQNIKALLVLADIRDMSCGGIGKDLFERLHTVKTNDNELMSMIEYAKARYCYYENAEKYEECLIRSVNFYSKHVKNNAKLGEIYLNRGQIKEGCQLIRQALKSVTCIFPETYMYFTSPIFSITTVDDFIAYFITGTRISYSHVNDLGEFYVRCRSQISEKI